MNIDPLDLVDPVALRGARLPPRRVDEAARGGAGRAHRGPGVPTVLGDHQARRHRADLGTAAALLERAGRHAPEDRRAAAAAVGDGRPARSPEARPDAPGRHGTLHAACRACQARRHRAHRRSRSSTDAGTDGVRRVRLRAARRRAVPARGDGLEPRRAARRLASCCTAGRTRSSARTTPSSAAPGERPGQTFARARGELHALLRTPDRGAPASSPDDDLVSVLLAAELDGEPLNAEQLLEYCEVLVEAGNETTRNAISGGVLAFCEHPDAVGAAARAPRAAARRRSRRSCAGSARSRTSRVSRPRTARCAA